MPPTILITGAAGFIGQALAAELLRAQSTTHLILTDTSEPPEPSVEDCNPWCFERLSCVAADLTSPSSIPPLLPNDLVAVYALHGIMSSGSEANLDLGLKVNLDSHRYLLDALRKHPKHSTSVKKIKYVFPSSTAIFAANPPDELYNEMSLPLPGGSYGAQKFMVELLVNDFSRRGLIDGRIARLPTVIVRPGKPTAAASSFASGIVRESFAGIPNILPVKRELEIWVCSPGVVVRNLVRLKDVDAERFGRAGRRVNLPGLTVKVGEIVDTVRKVGGAEVVKMIEERRDPEIEKLVENWPTRFDVQLAKTMGLEEDVGLEENVRAYVAGLKK